MLEITMSDFIDFVAKAGEPKLTKVRQVKTREPYRAAIDYWKPLRDEIVRFHKEGLSDGNQLNSFVLNLRNQKKKSNYFKAVDGYRKFLGRKSIQWCDTTKGFWTFGELEVRVNPDLGLVIGGVRYFVKLYFKNDGLARRRVDVILTMMEEALRSELQPTDRIAILEVTQGKLFESNSIKTQLRPLLIGEASSFIAIWNSI